MKYLENLLVRTLVTVPDKSWITGLFIGDWRNMTFLMVEVLATGAFHQLVAALLGEVLAHAAAAVVEVQVRVLVITPGVAQIYVIDVSTTWWRCG